MNLALFPTDKVIELCFMTSDELDKEIVKIATRTTQPDSLSYFGSAREEDLQRIEIINKIKARKS